VRASARSSQSMASTGRWSKAHAFRRSNAVRAIAPLPSSPKSKHPEAFPNPTTNTTAQRATLQNCRYIDRWRRPEEHGQPCLPPWIHSIRASIVRDSRRTTTCNPLFRCSTASSLQLKPSIQQARLDPLGIGEIHHDRDRCLELV
jgi:hypothetical protein